MGIAYIGIGGNLGDREKNVQDSLNVMTEEGIEVIQVASFIETAPYGGVEQPNFINTVCQIKTTLKPLELLKTLKTIESRIGRTPTVHWGPRLIDLDILLYDDLIVVEEGLQIPHQDMLNREFVLKPLVEIAPEAIHPVRGQTIREEWKLFQEKLNE